MLPRRVRTVVLAHAARGAPDRLPNMMRNDPNNSNQPQVTRRSAFPALLVPAAGLLLGGCTGAQRTRALSSQPEIPDVRGGFALRSDGTRVFRNHRLVDQDGRTVRFQDDLVEGRVFGATFQYANCKGICSNMTEQMRKAYELMRPIMGERVQFYMFSLAEDSPEDMKRFMKAHGIYGLNGWRFLSAPREAITDIRWAFGFGDPNEDIDQNLAAHTGMVRFGNHSLDKWAACPAQGSPEATARLLVRMFPSTERPELPNIASRIATPAKPIKGWTPASPITQRGS
jgi:cytochrome oxidase Cu insertion factor (SCO1/SenC/PrrC family)